MKTPEGKTRKTGLALGGGAVLGAAHIGVIRALEEHGIEIDLVAGTSIGAFIGALYATGMPWKEIQSFAMDLEWLDTAGLSISKYGLLSNEKMGHLLEKTAGVGEFSDLKIIFATVAADIASGEKVVLKEGSVAQAVTASACLPGIFSPVEIGDRLLVDGGILENVPVLTLKELGADRVIGVDLNANQAIFRPNNLVEVMINTVNMALINSARLQTQECDLLIAPDLSGLNPFDTNQVEALVEKGYAGAKDCLKQAGL